MLLIHPSIASGFRDRALTVALAMLVVGGVAVILMALLPSPRVAPIALLGLSAALALGVGAGMAWRAMGRARRRRERINDDLAGLLVGPAGVKALITRRWRGRYRVRGRGWEYDTRSRAGWIPTLTNPTFDADAVADSVARWARGALDDQACAIAGAVAFPRGYSTVVLEEPTGEVVTADNAPWWAQSIGRVQRLDPRHAARFVEAVLSASEAEAASTSRATTPELA